MLTSMFFSVEDKKAVKPSSPSPSVTPAPISSTAGLRAPTLSCPSTPLSGSVDEGKEESKEVSLQSDSRVAFLKQLKIPITMKRSGMASKTFPITLGFSTMLTTTSTGLVNAVFNASNVVFSNEFVSCATLFDEFFIKSFTIHYEPLNQFLTEPSMSLASPASGMLLMADLHHGQTSYATTSGMCNAITLMTHHSGRPFTYRWKNVERPRSGVAPSSTTSTPLPTQAWCLTTSTAAVLYTGFTQIRNNTLFANDPSTSLGDVVQRFECLFRTRV
jgi:hypothetical protein